MSVGMVIMRPTSIVVAGAGSSASIRAAGGVEFASATSLSLNGVFTSDFDDYMIVMNTILGSGDTSILGYYRASGADAQAANYTYQYILASNTSVTAARASGFIAGYTSSSNRNGTTCHVYGPALAQPTASRQVNVTGSNGALVLDAACTHSVSTSYDGITLYVGASSMSGQLTVYGLAQ